MAIAKAIQLYLADGTLNGILTIQEPAGWGSGILVSAPRENFDQLLKRPEVDNAGIYFLLSESQVYIGQSHSSIKTRLTTHDKKKDWWDRVIFLTKTDKSLRATDVQYLEVEFIKLALKNQTADMDNKNGGNQNGYISEFDRAANDQFMQEALLLLEVIGITVFMKKNKLEQPIVATIPETIHTTNPRTWHPAIADYTFYYRTKNGGDAQMKWISPNEFVLLAGSILGKSFSNNSSGQYAQKLRAQYTDRINDYILNTDIIFPNPNPTSNMVVGRAANAWTEWKTNQKETLDKVIHRLNQATD
ncbi:GIY-YIG nuclease family protein [Enterococcus bulliens]